MVSNKKIYKLSKKVRENNGAVSDDELLMIQDYRTSFTHPLSATFHKIRRIANKFDKEAIVAFRLKRIGTIINKLLRLPDTYITTMGDIAGIRCIFNSQEALYKTLESIKDKFEHDDRIRDYIVDSKEIGYKGVHIYVRHKQTGKKIEVQLRTTKDHNWATLVEITDFLYDLRLKELGAKSDEDFAKFHALLSSDKELTEDEAHFIYMVLDKTDFITKLSRTFRNNNKAVKLKWAEQARNHSFFLIEASKQKVPHLRSFSSFKKAEEQYFKRYLENQDAEIVLTSIPKPDFKQISIAYANYILSYHNFMSDIKPILKQMAVEALEDRKFSKFKKIFITYENLQANMLIYTFSDTSDIIINDIKKGKVNFQALKKVSTSKNKDIIKKIGKRILVAGEEHNEFIEELKSKMPTSFFSRILCERFLKKHNKRLKKRLSQKDFEFESTDNIQ